MGANARSGRATAMKLIIAIIHQRVVRRLRDALIDHDLSFTELGSTGGYSREGNLTLLLVIEEARVDEVVDLISAHCQSRETMASASPAHLGLQAHPTGEGMLVTVGGAHLFVLNVERVITM